jgi:hypothetical protein
MRVARVEPVTERGPSGVGGLVEAVMSIPFHGTDRASPNPTRL